MTTSLTLGKSLDGTRVVSLTDQVRDLEHVEFLWAFSGGAYSGIVHTVALQQAYKAWASDTLVCGTSVGSLAALSLAAGRPEVFEDLFMRLDDARAWDGVEGFMAPRAVSPWEWLKSLIGLSPTPGGLLSLDPLEATIRKELDGVQRPYAVGVQVKQHPAEHLVVVMGPDTPWDVQVAMVKASCAMAGVTEPVHVTLDGKDLSLADGGHHSLVPLPPLDLMPNLRVARAFFTIPAYNPPPEDRAVDGLLPSFRWSVTQAMGAARRGDMAELRAWAADGVRVEVGAPEARIGSFMDASREVLTARRGQADSVWYDRIILRGVPPRAPRMTSGSRQLTRRLQERRLGLAEVDPDGVILAMDGGATELVGTTAAEWVGKQLPARYLPYVKAAMNGETITFAHRDPLTGKYSEVVQYAPMGGHDGEPVGAMITWLLGEEGAEISVHRRDHVPA